MNYYVNNHSVYVIVLVTFLSSIAFTYLSKIIANYIGALDVPNQRSAHTKPTPLLGGIGIFLSFLLGYMLFGRESTLMLSILISSFLILLLGIFDDLKPIPAKIKFIIHIAIASIVVFYGELVLQNPFQIQKG